MDTKMRVKRFLSYFFNPKQVKTAELVWVTVFTLLVLLGIPIAMLLIGYFLHVINFIFWHSYIISNSFIVGAVSLSLLAIYVILSIDILTAWERSNDQKDQKHDDTNS